MAKTFHMVILKFSQPAKADGLFDELRGLQTLLAIREFSAGPYASPEGLNKSFTHGFVMTFDDPAARDHYLAHPEHEKVKNKYLPFVEDIVAFDFDA